MRSPNAISSAQTATENEHTVHADEAHVDVRQVSTLKAASSRLVIRSMLGTGQFQFTRMRPRPGTFLPLEPVWTGAGLVLQFQRVRLPSAAPSNGNTHGPVAEMV
jgi:hypothetical protein